MMGSHRLRPSWSPVAAGREASACADDIAAVGNHPNSCSRARRFAGRRTRDAHLQPFRPRIELRVIKDAPVITPPVCSVLLHRHSRPEKLAMSQSAWMPDLHHPAVMAGRARLSEYFPDITKAQETLEPHITSLVSILGGKLPQPTIASIRSRASVEPFAATDILFRSLAILNSPALPVVVKFCQNTPEVKHVLAPKYRHGVAVLSLDGGGVRGYATLLILDHIMTTIQKSLNLSELLKPCEVFDLICGTSTGGLIAILLGRLRLTVPEAIEHYLRLGPKIFGDEANVLGTVMNGAKFDEKLLEEEFAQLVRAHEGSAEAEMFETPGKVPCFTFVTTVSVGNSAPPSPYKICNYRTTQRPPGPRGHKWTVVQAARATSAAPVYFKPLSLPYSSFKFQDAGALGFNNPAQVVRHEISQIHELTDRALQVMLSLGTGMGDITRSAKHDDAERQKAEQNFIDQLTAKAAGLPGLTEVSGNVEALKQIGKDLVSVATDSNRVDLEVRYKIREAYPEAYFRFSPGAGLGKIVLSDYQETAIMKSIVGGFLQKDSVKEEIKRCVELLLPIAELKQFLARGSDDTLTSRYFPGYGALASATPYTPYPHAVSNEEAESYYADLPSGPTLLYRTGKKWSLPRGPVAQRPRKELCEVFKHPIANLWNDGLCWKVTEIMDAHNVLFTTMDVVRFKMAEVDEALEAEVKEPAVNPVTIWIGVYPWTTTATAAHDAAQAVLRLLVGYRIADVDVDFRESFYTRKIGPQLLKHVDDLDPLAQVISPFTPALGLHISTDTRPGSQGTMALYLSKDDDSNNLLGLTCRHVLFGPKETNVGYNRTSDTATIRKVLLLGERACAQLAESIKLEIRGHETIAKHRRKQIERYRMREAGTDAEDVEKARQYRVKTQALLDDGKMAMEALEALLERVEQDWAEPGNRVLGPVVFSPAIGLGVGEERFTEDWGIFEVDRAKLGDGFQGNKMDLGTKIKPDEFTLKCSPGNDANWTFEYPADRLLPLGETITDELMRNPDMLDVNGDPCLLVVKSGNGTGTTLGRANGVRSIVREYNHGNVPDHSTSMEWAIVNYDSKSEVFSGSGDSGSIIADTRGRIGGMLTGGSGMSNASDVTYATPFWWLLKRIHARFPNPYPNVV